MAVQEAPSAWFLGLWITPCIEREFFVFNSLSFSRLPHSPQLWKGVARGGLYQPSEIGIVTQTHGPPSTSAVAVIVDNSTVRKLPNGNTTRLPRMEDFPR
jgi:hypothetical protein